MFEDMSLRETSEIVEVDQLYGDTLFKLNEKFDCLKLDLNCTTDITTADTDSLHSEKSGSSDCFCEETLICQGWSLLEEEPAILESETQKQSGIEVGSEGDTQRSLLPVELSRGDQPLGLETACKKSLESQQVFRIPALEILDQLLGEIDCLRINSCINKSSEALKAQVDLRNSNSAYCEDEQNSLGNNVPGDQINDSKDKALDNEIKSPSFAIEGVVGGVDEKEDSKVLSLSPTSVAVELQPNPKIPLSFKEKFVNGIKRVHSILLSRSATIRNKPKRRKSDTEEDLLQNLPGLKSLRTPNGFNEYTEFVVDPNHTYEMGPRAHENSYEPIIVRNNLINPKEGPAGLCPFCPSISFFPMKTSAYLHHLTVSHGVFSNGTYVLDPDVMVGEVLTSTGTRKLTEFFVCPYECELKEVRMKKINKEKPGQNRYKVYLRHVISCHRSGKRELQGRRSVEEESGTDKGDDEVD